MLGFLLVNLISVAVGVGAYVLGERTRSWWLVVAIAGAGLGLALVLSASSSAECEDSQLDSVSCGLEELAGVIVGVATMICAGLAAIGVRAGRARERRKSEREAGTPT